MPPLRLTIEGQYWDSLLYKGRLYLFRMDGSILTLNWDKIIDTLSIPNSLKIASDCGFRRSDYLYGEKWDLIFSDHEIKNLITEKFEELASHPLQVPATELSQFQVGEQENPLPFPHTDALIYYNSIYTASSDGIFRATCGKRTTYPVSSRPKRIWDCPVLGMAASYRCLALATGSEGLFELSLDVKNEVYHRIGPNEKENGEPLQISDRHCSSCNWAYYSIYGSSHATSGFLAAYEKEAEDTRKTNSQTFKFDQILLDKQMFSHAGYSWGIQDKLCQVTDGTVRVIKYDPWARTNQEKFLSIGDVELPESYGRIVSGGVAPFGMVIERDDAVTVLLSTGETHMIPVEPVNWRVFPSSKYYTNHLHVVCDDYLEINSFNSDYFVDQRNKISGLACYDKGKMRHKTSSLV